MVATWNATAFALSVLWSEFFRMMSGRSDMVWGKGGDWRAISRYRVEKGRRLLAVGMQNEWALGGMHKKGAGTKAADRLRFHFSFSLSPSRSREVACSGRNGTDIRTNPQRLPVTCNDLSHCQPSTSFSPSVLPRSNRRIPEPGTSAGDEPIEPNPKMELSLFPVHAVTCWRCNRIWISSCPPNPPPLIRLSPSLPRRSEIGNLHSWPTSSPRQTHLK